MLNLGSNEPPALKQIICLSQRNPSLGNFNMLNLLSSLPDKVGKGLRPPGQTILPLKQITLTSTRCKGEPRRPSKDPQAVTRNGRDKGDNYFVFFFVIYRVFSLDVTVAVFVSQSNEKAGMLVYQTKVFQFSDELALLLLTLGKTLYSM